MKFTLVYYSDSLALRTCDSLGGYKVYLRTDAEYLCDSCNELPFLVLDILDCIGELLLAHLNIYIESICVVQTVDLDLIVGSIALCDKNSLDL